jgi:hypothetical protein
MLSTEGYGNNIAGSEQNYKPEAVLHYNGTRGTADAEDQMTREYS